LTHPVDLTSGDILHNTASLIIVNTITAK